MTAQPVTLKVIRHPQAPELGELSALSIIWGLARAIIEAPPDALDFFRDELMGGVSAPQKERAGE